MADHIGRWPVLVLANVLALLGNVATAFTYNLTDFAASRLLAGLATDTNFFMMYIIGKNRQCSETRRKNLTPSFKIYFNIILSLIPNSSSNSSYIYASRYGKTGHSYYILFP